MTAMFPMRLSVLLVFLISGTDFCVADTLRHWRYYGGMPISMTEQVSHHVRKGYDIGFSRQYGCCLWVAYSLVPQDLAKNVGRVGAFIRDDDLKEDATPPEAYICSGYDRGHMAPSRDMQYDVGVSRQSFWMGNIVPQKPRMNRFIWKNLEERVRSLVKMDEKGRSRATRVYVMTGPIFSHAAKMCFKTEMKVYEKNGRKGKRPVIKPYACWKIYKYGATAVAVIVDQNCIPRSVSPAEISRLTGLVFFDDLSEGLKRHYNGLCRMIYPPAELAN